ncbi:5'-3' exonuclease, C-terminal SAM fold family protein [Mycobacterium kansasii]|uniref:5'-3' exonuclease n=1 Tax=Mycobacterium kansasii TaxID=1768 RepID=A0A1V3WHY9_MYCKA|nr:5'-3' exonuclease, C-terminal SAM fold family protein [Mycobacterium kansasii]
MTVLYPRKGVSELTRFTPEAVVEKYGLTPAQYPDFAALRGDPSDNLPGIPGVGEKTATKWIAEYGSLQELVDHVDSVRGKVGDALRAHVANVVRNRELTELVRDVPLAQTPDTLRLQPWDRDHIHRLFDDLEFRVLRDRLFDTLAAVEPEVDEGFDVRGGTLQPGTVAQWLAAHAGDGRRCGLTVVGTHLPHGGDTTALAIAAADGDGGYIGTATVTPEDDAALAAWLADPAKPKALHEAKLAIHDLGAAAGPWTASPPTPHWPPTWCGRASAASPSTISRCATCAASCARKRLNSNNFHCSTIWKEWTTKPSKPRSCGPGRWRTWPKRWTPNWPASIPRPCWPTWNCPCSGCWPTWSAPASPSTCDCWPSCKASSPTRSATPPRPHTPSSASRSTSARPSSCRSCCSTNSGCRRPSGPRPATPPTPTLCRAFLKRPGTRSCSICWRTATSPGSRSPSTGC